MRPSVQLLSVLGADFKLGLTVVWRKPGLQSAPDPPPFYWPPIISKHNAIFLFFFCHLVTLTFDLFNWKLALHLLVLLGAFLPVLVSVFFELWARKGRIGWQDAYVMRPTGRPHNNTVMALTIDHRFELLFDTYRPTPCLSDFCIIPKLCWGPQCPIDLPIVLVSAMHIEKFLHHQHGIQLVPSSYAVFDCVNCNCFWTTCWIPGILHC